MKHTPGPWKAECVGSGGDYDNPTDVFEITNGYKRIAEFVSGEDARLLAAAPDMHDALVLMLKAFDRLPDLLPHETEALGAGRAALAKVGQ